MSIRPNTVSSRIVAALKLQPLTARQLVTMVHASDQHVRACLAELAADGSIRKGSAAPRFHRKGAQARFWEAA